MPAYNENGDYVLEDGSVIPARFAEAAGFGMQLQPPEPVVDPLTLPNPQPAPPHLAGMATPPAPQPSPEYVRQEPPQGLTFQQPEPPPQQGVVGQVQEQPQPTDGLPALEQAPYEDRVAHTEQGYSTHPNRQHLRAEYAESGADLLQNSADSKFEADKKQLLAETESFVEAERVNRESLAFAGMVAEDLDKSTNEIRARGAQLRQELDSFELDPNRVFRKQGNWANVADTIAVAFGALAQYSTGQNAALQLIRKKVEDDMTSQEVRRKQTEGQYNRLSDEIEGARNVYDNAIAKDSVERALKFQVIENKMRAAMEGARTDAARAAYQQGLFQVIQWKEENLSKAEKAALAAEAQAIQLQVASMKKAGAGAGKGRGFSFSGKSVAIPPAYWDKGAAIVVPGADGKTQRVQSIEIEDDVDRRKVRDALNATQGIGDAVSTVLAMGGTEGRIPDETWKLAKQEMAGVLLQYQQLIKGNPSDKENKIVTTLIGFEDPAEMIRWLNEGERRTVLRNLIVKAEAVANREIGSVAPGARAEFRYRSTPLESIQDAPPLPADEARAQVAASAATGDADSASKLGDVKGLPKNEARAAIDAQYKAVMQGTDNVRASIEALLGRVPVNEQELQQFNIKPEVKQKARLLMKKLETFGQARVRLEDLGAGAAAKPLSPDEQAVYDQAKRNRSRR
jgi:hypothetical protein